jgi:hypothetical protein
MTESTPGADAGRPTSTGTDEPGAAGDGSRRRLLLIGGIVAGVLVVGGAAAALSGAFDGDEPLSAPSPGTIVLPSPTPTIQPAAREAISPFADALPASVLSYALVSVTEHAPLVAAGALEGYQVDYSDGGSGTVTLYAGQWETPEEVVAAYGTIVTSDAAAVAPEPAATAPAGEATPSATAQAPTTGQVVVGGQPVGEWTVVTAPDGTGTVTWTNGTALLQLVGPADVVTDLYTAFPL